MADSALSCSSHCWGDDAPCSELACAADTADVAGQHVALLQFVASANQLAGSSMLSVSPAGPDRSIPQVDLQLARSSAEILCTAECISPLELSNLALVPRGPSWHTLQQTGQQDSKASGSKKAPARRCLLLEVASDARAVADDEGHVLPAPKVVFPCTPAPARPAQDCSSCTQSSSESRRRIQQWLSNMELKLQIPASPMLPPTEPCPAPTGAVGKARKRSSSATAAALLTDFERSSKRTLMAASAQQQQQSTPAAAVPSAYGTARAAAAATEVAARDSADMGDSNPLHVQLPLEDAPAAAADEEAVAWTPGTIPPPAFVILGLLSKESNRTTM